jgi:hypothetical protein
MVKILVATPWSYLCHRRLNVFKGFEYFDHAGNTTQIADRARFLAEVRALISDQLRMLAAIGEVSAVLCEGSSWIGRKRGAEFIKRGQRETRCPPILGLIISQPVNSRMNLEELVVPVVESVTVSMIVKSPLLGKVTSI